jgi:2-polyprenyl-3-methyl-5-hydroxy-6-metoxy-1,4-benzoquinol methylase
MKKEDTEDLLKREESFHDEWAESENIEETEVRAFFESFVAVENRFMLGVLGDLKGKKILDVGAGLGESSVYFALCGAEVYYNDISPKMGEFALKLAEKHRVKINTLIAPVERLEVGTEFFDIIYCANLMHHVPEQDHDFWIENMYRALKKNGILLTWDPLKYNPVINVYRRMAMEVRTEDEKPLGFDILKKYRQKFSKVEHREFWLGTLVIFLYYYFVKRYDPNKIRYWKQIYKEKESKIGWWFNALKAADHFLLKIPLINRLAWNIVIVARK